MPAAVASQCVDATTPKVPRISGRVVNLLMAALVVPCQVRCLHSPAPCGRGLGAGSRAGRRERFLWFGRSALWRAAARIPLPQPPPTRGGGMSGLGESVVLHPASLVSRTSRKSRRASPMKLMESTVSMMARPGKMPSHQAREMKLRASERMSPQVGVVGLDAEPQERQAGLGQDRVGDADRGLHDDRRRRVGQDMPPHDPEMGDADRLRRRDVRLFLDRQHHAAGDAGEIVEEGERYRRDQVGEAGAEYRHEIDGDDEVRKRPLQVDVAHDDVIEPAPEIARKHAERDPGDERDGDRGDADEQRHLRAHDDAAQEIAAEIVGAEPVRPARRQQHVEGHGVGVVGRDQRPDHGQQRQHRKESRADERLLVPPEHGAQLHPAGAAPGRESDIAEDRFAHLS